MAWASMVQFLLQVLACPQCATLDLPVEVHGHLQCARCGYVLEPCCQGAPA
jgi:uncharacterized protein YbaR (Trm112 family)